MTEQELKKLSAMVANLSGRGEWYDGEGTTHVSDWIAEGDEDHLKSTTPQELANEWDE